MLKRQAFTTIELMVVIGVIVLLSAITIVGIRYASNQSKTSATRIRLASLKTMWAEFEGKNKMLPRPLSPAPTPVAEWIDAVGVRVPYVAPVYPADFSAAPADPTPDFWRVPQSLPASNWRVIFMPAPGPVTETAFDSGVTDRFDSSAVLNSAIALRELGKVPANRTALGQMPTSDFMQVQVPRDADPDYQAQVMLDAWGNPIVFVPASGLGGVNLDGTIVIVTSEGLRASDILQWRGPGDVATYAAGVYVYHNRNGKCELYRRGVVPGNSAQAPFTDPNPDHWLPASMGKPFFASAGPDGDFTTGEDNLYSFEQ